MGIFKRRSKTQGSDRADDSSGGAGAAHYDISVDGVDSSENARLAGQFFAAAGLTVAIHGSGTSEELCEYVRRRCPRVIGEFQNGCMTVRLPSLQLSCFLFDSPSGAAFVMSETTTDGEVDTALLMDVTPLGGSDVESPWELDLASRGETSSEGLARRVASGMLVRPTFVEAQPESSFGPLIAELAAGAWSPLTGSQSMVGTNVDVGDGRTQVVFAGSYDANFRIESAVAFGAERSDHVESLIADGTIPLEDGYFFVPVESGRERAGLAIEIEAGQVVTAEMVNDWAVSLASTCDAIEANLWGDDQL